MEYPLQALVDVAQLCAAHGVRSAVLSPGSRCAPLTIAFARHPDIKTYTISDERAAAFVALGMAQQSKSPVVMVCTSGSAALNYAPAIAEAYYRYIPLIVLTADRPPEWIDQWDGQTIRQTELYGKHVKAGFQLPHDYNHPDARWHINRILNEALNLSKAGTQGPVHINVPIREPFYPQAEHIIRSGNPVRVVKEIPGHQEIPEYLWQELSQILINTPRVLVVPGQGCPSPELLNQLNTLPFPLISELISNTHGVASGIKYYDLLLNQANTGLEGAEVLITFGQSVLSKTLKGYLRRQKNLQHWHIQEHGYVPDPFGKLNRIIRTSPLHFFRRLQQKFASTQWPATHTDWQQAWQQASDKATKKVLAFLEQSSPVPLAELDAVATVLAQLPYNSVLHLANSMAVRYASAIHLASGKQVEVHCNRGTSGIDGSNSTAVGHAIADPERQHILITGDMAYLYDRNAFWHNYMPANLCVIVLNNAGGGIFRMIDGPLNLPENAEYFVTHQTFTAQASAQEAGFTYIPCRSLPELQQALSLLIQARQQFLLVEIFTQQQNNEARWQQWKNITKQIEL
jgi:2-succinyl-5-enolpyruvyl-6-hydroxy-3-cyclohexene-1-carboxylate synthase